MTKQKITKSNQSSVYGKLVAWLTAVTLMMSSLLLIAQPAYAADLVVYKSPTCGCCKNWVSHLEEKPPFAPAGINRR